MSDIINVPDFEIRIKGHSLVSVQGNGVKVDGRDFHRDVENISDVIKILSSVLESAQEMGRPRIVAEEGRLTKRGGIMRKAQSPFPYKVISNA